MQAERHEARATSDDARKSHAQRDAEQALGRFDEAREHDRDEHGARGLDRGGGHERGTRSDLPRIELGKPAPERRALRGRSVGPDGPRCALPRARAQQ